MKKRVKKTLSSDHKSKIALSQKKRWRKIKKAQKAKL